jgi:hypothetical protein
MRKMLFVLAVLAVCAPTAPANAALTTKYKNCTELKKKYPKGVALTKAAASKTGAAFLPALYRANSSMDRDKDKAACES